MCINVLTGGGHGLRHGHVSGRVITHSVFWYRHGHVQLRVDTSGDHQRGQPASRHWHSLVGAGTETQPCLKNGFYL